jgi:1-phosphofructokinase
VGGPSVVVFGPSPLLEISIEPMEAEGPRIRVLPGGQAVWVAQMAATMGSEVVMCGFVGGETGRLLAPMLARLPFECRLVDARADSGRFVVDQRQEPATEVASEWARHPTDSEIDDLLATTLATARDADLLVVCNPMPGEALPLDVYSMLVASCVGRGQPVVVDLSTPRLDAALRGGPALVKLNDWELAEVVRAPVDAASAREEAVARLLALGAEQVVVTRGPSTVVAFDRDGSVHELSPPRVGDGRAAGCGDAMTGAMAAMLAQGTTWLDAVRVGMAAGAAHYRGRGESSREAIESLAREVRR